MRRVSGIRKYNAAGLMLGPEQVIYGGLQRCIGKQAQMPCHLACFHPAAEIGQAQTECDLLFCAPQAYHEIGIGLVGLP